jgi:peptidoglycan/xylan/chitin deacetylase (PgdA/CDA1 family)
MTRRTAITLMAAPAIVPARKRIAITMDDVAWKSIPEPWAATADARLLEALHGHQVALFATGRNIDNDTGRQIIARWRAAGHIIGNHTYRHQPLRAPAEDFEQDVLKNAALLPSDTKFFRFPLLKEGNTREIRDELRRFLRENHYRNGAVTIDASDWYYSQRLADRLKVEPKFDVNRYREPYLAHLWDRAQYYDSLSQACLNHGVSHTILIHYNLINTLFLPDVLRMFRSRGWEIIGAEQSFADPVFQREPDTVPAGESLIWAIAKESGKFDTRLRYPGEDDVYEKPKLDSLNL